MELRHLRCFLAVAEELHFARAAERLHIGLFYTLNDEPILVEQAMSLDMMLTLVDAVV